VGELGQYVADKRAEFEAGEARNSVCVCLCVRVRNKVVLERQRRELCWPHTVCNHKHLNYDLSNAAETFGISLGIKKEKRRDASDMRSVREAATSFTSMWHAWRIPTMEGKIAANTDFAFNFREMAEQLID
jgi:hypothetical protein